MGVPGRRITEKLPWLAISSTGENHSLGVPSRTEEVLWMVSPNRAIVLRPSRVIRRCGAILTDSVVLDRTKSPGASVSGLS